MSKAENQAETDLQKFFQVMVSLTAGERLAVMEFLNKRHATRRQAAESGPTPGGSGDTGQ